MTFATPILATDLDGTFIPLNSVAKSSPDVQALREISSRVAAGDMELIYVTGRHLSSVLDAIIQNDLPTPNVIICDVGSSIYFRAAQVFEVHDGYANHLSGLTGTVSTNTLRSLFHDVPTLRLQEPEKQQRFKLSFYCDAERLTDCTAAVDSVLTANELPFGVVASLDPFDNVGLIDVMPQGVHKAYALHWWTQTHGLDPQSIVFAGDSGNDFAALTGGFRGILVGNSSAELAERIRLHHQQSKTLDQIYFAKSCQTAGVLEGCRHFGICNAVG